MRTIFIWLVRSREMSVRDSWLHGKLTKVVLMMDVTGNPSVSVMRIRRKLSWLLPFLQVFSGVVFCCVCVIVMSSFCWAVSVLHVKLWLERWRGRDKIVMTGSRRDLTRPCFFCIFTRARWWREFRWSLVSEDRMLGEMFLL